jgi:hypothetical protein
MILDHILITLIAADNDDEEENERTYSCIERCVLSKASSQNVMPRNLA